MSLKQFLGIYYKLPKHLIYSIRRAERVTVNSKYQPVNFDIHPGDKIALCFIPDDFTNPFPNIQIAHNQKLKILYETKDVIVVDKQRGDKTHPNQPDENGATINQLAGYLETKGTVPYMIHRLDQETSGAIIFAKSPAAVPALVDDIRHKLTKRSYLAWIHGIPSHLSGTINIPIGQDPDDKRKRKPDEIAGQSAITHYQVCESINNYSLVKINLETGRTHQIRVHFSAIGHPLVGDPLYASDEFANLLLHSETVRSRYRFITIQLLLRHQFQKTSLNLNNTY